MAIDFNVQHTSGAARAGEMTLNGHKISTPVFMPVATQAVFRNLTTNLIEQLGYKIILANAYHLHISPTEEIIGRMGGLHRFMNYAGAIITDSGGYQVFSLPNLKISERGVSFAFKKGAQPVELGPEKSIAIQQKLGSDIIMAFDECVDKDAGRNYVERSLELSLRWLERCITSWTAEQSQLFGIVQGGMFDDLRRRSAERTASYDLPGIAIGGLSVGEGLETMARVLDNTVPYLPSTKPRYLMGVGLPEDILAAIERGVDMFDCVIPTKFARSGVLFTAVGKLRISKSQFATDAFPPDTSCSCMVCSNYTRAYLHHLLSIKSPIGDELIGYHNLAFYAQLMKDARRAITQSRFASFKDDFLAKYTRNTKKYKHVS